MTEPQDTKVVRGPKGSGIDRGIKFIWIVFAIIVAAAVLFGLGQCSMVPEVNRLQEGIAKIGQKVDDMTKNAKPAPDGSVQSPKGAGLETKQTVPAKAGAASTAPVAPRASSGKHPFLRGKKNPEALAQGFEQSLKEDPMGNAIIDPARCKLDHSCASPSDYLAMFKENDPEAGLTKVSELPAFVRSLVEQPPGPGEYYMACLTKVGNDEYVPVLHCMQRAFKPGEKVWVDPKSNRKVLAGDCTNPIERPVEEKGCMEVMVFVKNERAMKFAHLGPAKVADTCLALRKVEGNQPIPLKEYVGDCDFTEAAEYFGEPAQEVYCAPVTAGTYVLTVARKPYGENSTRHWWIFCWTFADGESSQTMRVRDFDYIGNDVRRARIWNSRKDMEANTHPKGVSHLWIPRGETLGADR